MRGVIGAAGFRGIPAGALFFAAVWGNELVMLPTLGVAPPATEWGREELAVDAGHHVVYAATTSLVYEFLDSSTARSISGMVQPNREPHRYGLFSVIGKVLTGA